jgi:hypothetical protein
MYFVDENGHEKPTPEALEDLATIVMFRSGVWFMAIIDMVFKFTIVSFLGVVFQDHQVAGACTSALCCAAIMAFFALKKPYLYAGGNHLSVASYGSLLAAFGGALTEKLEHEEYDGYVVNQGFKDLLFVTWLLPYIVLVAELTDAPHFIRRAAKCCCHHHQRESKPAANGRHLHDIKKAFKSEHKRGLYVLSTFQSLLPIVREVVHAAGVNAKQVNAVAAGSKAKKAWRLSKLKNMTSKPAWDERKDFTATVALAKALDEHLCSMIDAFSNGGRDADSDWDDTTSSLTGNYRPLYWHHFVEAEMAASRLSQLAFPFTDICRDKAENQGSGVQAGFVRKSFDKRHLLWGNPITYQLQRVQEETQSRVDATKEAKKEAETNDGDNFSMTTEKKTGRRATVKATVVKKPPLANVYDHERSHPTMKDMCTWREVIVAMLKPTTDFGLHRVPAGEFDMSDTAKSLMIQTRSGVVHAAGDAENVAVDDDETKTQVQIHDGGDGGGGGVGAFEMASFGSPMPAMPPTTPKLHVKVTLRSRAAESAMGIKISPVGGKVVKVRMRKEKQLTSIVRTGDILVLVGDQPVTSTTTHAEIGTMLRTAAYPVVLRFSCPDTAELTFGVEEDDGNLQDDESQNHFATCKWVTANPLHVEGGGAKNTSGGDNISMPKNSILRHVAKHLQSDPDVVLQAVRRDGDEMMHASEELKGDKTFILNAIGTRPLPNHSAKMAVFGVDGNETHV